ncbi:ATP-binding protein [Bacillus tianshenii]|uniref:AAA family ATPase n=1 Tax=Sutcliffiella tianshenii TaxID=1463404 RepID=UPI001CD247EE|nr:AAA family ATPase [Bacillus tianshenii]MCA1319579.1 ATP-binding protein [Bacillus tianshenii]
MKRLLIMTVGKTHSGKSTFAGLLEKELENSIVMDQDNHAEFINTYYRKLQPKQGPNTLKHDISHLIVEYAKKQTDSHLIICNSNRYQKGREYLLKNLFPPAEFFRIIVHFDIPDQVLQTRVSLSERSTKIFRSASTFEEVLKRQQAEMVTDPAIGEADHLFVIRDGTEVDSVIREIVRISQKPEGGTA